MEKQLRVEIISKGERKVTNYESEKFCIPMTPDVEECFRRDENMVKILFVCWGNRFQLSGKP